MTPLTVDCARVRQLLPDLLDGPAAALGEEERRFAEEHLRVCAGCREAHDQIADALGALEQLSAEDAARLRALADGELDPRPLARLAGACIAVVLLVVVGVAVSAAVRRPVRGAAPPPHGVVSLVPPAPRPLAVAVGAEVGIEVEPELVRPPIELPALDAPANPLAPPPADDVALARADDAAPAPAGEPAPVAVAPPAAEAAPAATPPSPAPAAPIARPVAPPLPAEVAAMLARLELSDGARLRDVTIFFARDPSARDRLGRGRAPALPTVRESSPADPSRCVLRPPSGDGSYRLLVGELLDAPCGLRLAGATLRVSGRTELEVTPAAFDAVAAIEGRSRRDPVLRAPVLVPSRSRAALIERAEPGPVAVFLEAMADPTLLEFRRLRQELARLEPEARDLERRLRAAIDDVRGLRGVAISVGDRARSVDVFASSRELSDALPRLLRTALLEAALEQPQDPALPADPRSAAIQTGVTATRDRHVQLLAALAGCRRREGARDVYERTDGPEVAAVWTSGDDLVHAMAIDRP